MKGDGEIVEEIVSKDRQKAINKVCENYLHTQIIYGYIYCSKQQWEMLCHSSKVSESASDCKILSMT